MRFAIAVLSCLALASGAAAQSQISTVTVKTSIPGVRFRVDGQEYRSAATFHWPTGSKHLLSFVVTDPSGFQYAGADQTRFLFQNWQDEGGNIASSVGPVLTVTADRTAAQFTLTVAVQYLVNLQFYDGPAPVEGAAAAVCGAPGSVTPGELRPGAVFVGGTCYWNSVQLWADPGPYPIQAFPFPGFVFLGWSINSNPPNSFLRQFDINGPTRLAPLFSPAKRVLFRTQPAGLSVYVDRTLVRTPEFEPCESNNYLPVMPPATIKPLCIGDFDFADNSTHVLGAPSPQQDKTGNYWVFDSFNTGTELNGAYVASGLGKADTVVAKFVRGVRTYITTSPSGLKVKINGRDNWSSPFFVFAPASKHSLEAAAEQTDARGRRYVFKGWSDGGTAAHEVTVPGDVDADFKLIAEYELLGQLKVHSQPAGAAIEVDGARCPTPCTIDRREGVEVRLSVPLLIPLSDVHRFEFTSWADGAARERVWKMAGGEAGTLTANFVQSYLLRTSSDPAGGARFRIEPAGADGYFPEGSAVTVHVEALPGYRFRRWGGDLSGTSQASTLSMERPRSVRALLDRVPFIDPAGVRNAAGLTPENVVAPGSLISIFGANLSAELLVGPESPLAQSLGDVSVLAANRILPLLFVSPEQINAQLPFDLPEGVHKLTVKRAGQTDIQGEFTVVSCAPGIFATIQNEQQYAMAFHADGSPVTTDSPARRGEIISVLATGFGALTPHALEGFALPYGPDYRSRSDVGILLGEWAPEAQWAGGSNGHVGVNAVRFRVPQELPAGVPRQLRLSMDGRDSNTVLLPVE